MVALQEKSDYQDTKIRINHLGTMNISPTIQQLVKYFQYFKLCC